MFLIALWCVGFVAIFFKDIAAHELGHGAVFKAKSLNTIFLHIVCMISWWDPYDYAASHTYHHRYTTHPHADRENLLLLTPSLHPWLVLQLMTLNLLSMPSRNFSKGGFLWRCIKVFNTLFFSLLAVFVTGVILYGPSGQRGEAIPSGLHCR